MSGIIEYDVPLLTIKCNTCRHYLHDPEGPDCKAFYKIPSEIIIGDITHDHIIDGQKGSYIYEPAEE